MNKSGMCGNHILTGTNANYEDGKIICYRNRVEISQFKSNLEYIDNYQNTDS